jgi:hypothetical protein
MSLRRYLPSSAVWFPYDLLDTIKVYSVPSRKDNSARGEVPMPRDDEVTQRAGSVRAMTG